MSGFELNKLAAAILIAGIVAMVAGFLAEILYHPEHPEKRGYSVAVEEGDRDEGAGVSEGKEEAIDIAALLKNADIAAGQAVAKKCVSCHVFEKDGPHRVGPRLWGVVGGKRAHWDDFAYSKAMMEKGGSWTYEELYAFLNNPKKVVPGTKMAFAGLKKPEDIANIIAYLRSLSDNPVPLP